MNISLKEVAGILQRRFDASRNSERQAFEESILHLKAQAKTAAEEILPYAEAIWKRSLEPTPDATTNKWLRKFYEKFVLTPQETGKLGFRPGAVNPDLGLAIRAEGPDMNDICVEILDTSTLKIEVVSGNTSCSFLAPKGSSVVEQIEVESQHRQEPIWCFKGVTDGINEFIKQMPDFRKRFTAYVESIRDLGDKE